MIEELKWTFFGSSEFSVLILNELKARSFLPSLVITVPDKPKGRKLLLTPNPVKVWANENSIEVLDPTSLKNNPELIQKLESLNSQFFLVASYGKMIPKEIFDIPKFKTLNIHPSLLPKYRGASPMVSQILNDEREIGTSIMLIDEGTDTGPVLVQKKITTSPLSPLLATERGEMPNIVELEKIMAKESADLFVEILPKYLSGEVTPTPQDNEEATYSAKIKKEDGLLDLAGDARKNLLKIKAFARWPRAHFFADGKRIIVTDATLDEEGKLKILKVIPEGKKEMPYEDFLRGQN